MYKLLILLTLTLGLLMSKAQASPPENNNPGNIKYSRTNNWLGQNYNNDYPFASFDRPLYGFRAMYKILHTYNTKHDINTIAEIILRYAPLRDNNPTLEYILFVQNTTAIGYQTNLDVEDYDTMYDVLHAMTVFEQGKFEDTWGESLSCGLISNNVFPKEVTE